MSIAERLQCLSCTSTYALMDPRVDCGCGGLLSVERPAGFAHGIDVRIFDGRLGSRADVDRSGVWRFREAVLAVPETAIVTHPEGGTRLYERPALSSWAGVSRVAFKHEGENPTGSFKDRGMTVAVTQAVRLAQRLAERARVAEVSGGDHDPVRRVPGHVLQQPPNNRLLPSIPEGVVGLGQ